MLPITISDPRPPRSPEFLSSRSQGSRGAPSRYWFMNVAAFRARCLCYSLLLLETLLELLLLLLLLLQLDHCLFSQMSQFFLNFFFFSGPLHASCASSCRSSTLRVISSSSFLCILPPKSAIANRFTLWHLLGVEPSSHTRCPQALATLTKPSIQPRCTHSQTTKALRKRQVVHCLSRKQICVF